MKFGDISNKVKKAVDDQKEASRKRALQRKADADKRAEEEAKRQSLEAKRQADIKAGKIQPIEVTLNLKPGEQAYFKIKAQRMASVDRAVHETTGTSKKKHVVGRALVGGVLLGPLGAVGGAATAGGKHTAKTIVKTISSVEQVDAGEIILTNKRFIFLGGEVLSLPYTEVIAAGFNDQAATIKYPDMLKDEYFVFSDQNASDTQLYYTGIKHKFARS